MQSCTASKAKRRLTETEIGWLSGYANSTPVRVGNAASGQFQLDVYGELMDSLHQARAHGIPPDEDAWRVQLALMDFLESHWRDPDNGLWEMRGPRRDFTYSKVMASTDAVPGSLRAARAQSSLHAKKPRSALRNASRVA